MRFLTAVALCTLVAACTTAPAVSNDIAAAEVALTTAETLALHYTSLPRCPQPTPVCSDQAVVDRIKALDNTAYAAVKGAQANSALLSTALAAIGALKAAIPGV